MSSKNTILAAAVRVLLRDGLMALTLDAVAKEAGVSKGGLLYHFRSKDDLIRGMIGHFQGQQEADIKRRAEADPDPKGRWLRAFVDASFVGDLSDGDIRLSRSETLALKMSLLSAIAMSPELVAEVSARCDAWAPKMFEGCDDPIDAWITCLATDGLWLWELFGLFPGDEGLRAQIIGRLRARTYGAVDASSPARRKDPAEVPAKVAKPTKAKPSNSVRGRK